MNHREYLKTALELASTEKGKTWLHLSIENPSAQMTPFKIRILKLALRQKGALWS